MINALTFIVFASFGCNSTAELFGGDRFVIRGQDVQPESLPTDPILPLFPMNGGQGGMAFRIRVGMNAMDIDQLRIQWGRERGIQIRLWRKHDAEAAEIRARVDKKVKEALQEVPMPKQSLK